MNDASSRASMARALADMTNAALRHFGRRGAEVGCLSILLELTETYALTDIDIAKAMGVNPHVIRNQLAWLGKETASGWPGHLMIDERVWLPRVEWRLTTKGRAVIESMGAALRECGSIGGFFNLQKALNVFRLRTYPTISSHAVRSFAAIACDEGQSLTHYAGQLQLKTSALSRQFKTLTDRSRTIRGHGLIVSGRNRNNLSYSEFRLTKRGRQLFDEMLAV